jgi:hypothetical protein
VQFGVSGIGLDLSLQQRNGAPERIVVDPVNSHDGKFVFSDEYALA